MFKVVLLLLALAFSAVPAAAQNTTCANKPASDSSNACANTRYVTTAITNAYPNVWLKSVMGSGQNATADNFSAANQAMWMVGNFTGSGAAPYALVSVNDTADGSLANPALAALFIAHNINNGAAKGNRFSLMPILTKNVAIPGTDTTKKFYTPFFAQHYINAGDGGSAVGPTYYGDHYGLSSLVQAQSGATYLDGVQGAEIDVSVQSGASTSLKSILLLASVNSDAVKGATYDGMLAFGADSTTTAKWTYGVTFGWPRGPWPFDTSSTLIGSVAPGSGSRVANYGIDLSGVTFSTSAFKSTGFSIGPSGAASVASLASAGAISGTTGTFSSTLGASTITSSGAAAGLVAAPRSGSGNSFQWYNASGADIRLSNGADLVTMDGSGNITTGANVTNLHNYTTISVPTPSACGTSPSVDAGSTNHAGKVTFGSATTACTLTFASAYATNAYCTVTPAAQPAAVANIPYISAQSKTAFTISGGTASASYYYTCGGN